MLYVRNYDKPGFIGGLGSILGAANINIATFHLGRRGDSGEAIAMVEVDQKFNDAVLAEVRALPQAAPSDMRAIRALPITHRAGVRLSHSSSGSATHGMMYALHILVQTFQSQ